MFSLILNYNLQACQYVLFCRRRKRSSGERCCTSEPIHPLPIIKNMFQDLSIIGGKLYVMRAGLIKKGLCPKCVSIGQRRMWRSTPKTSGKSLRKSGALKLFLVH